MSVERKNGVQAPHNRGGSSSSSASAGEVVPYAPTHVTRSAPSERGGGDDDEEEEEEKKNEPRRAPKNVWLEATSPRVSEPTNRHPDDASAAAKVPAGRLRRTSRRKKPRATAVAVELNADGDDDGKRAVRSRSPTRHEHGPHRGRLLPWSPSPPPPSATAAAPPAAPPPLRQPSHPRRLARLTVVVLASCVGLLVLVLLLAAAYWLCRGVPVSEVPRRLSRLHESATLTAGVHRTYTAGVRYIRDAEGVLRGAVAPLLYRVALTGFAHAENLARFLHGSPTHARTTLLPPPPPSHANVADPPPTFFETGADASSPAPASASASDDTAFFRDAESARPVFQDAVAAAAGAVHAPETAHGVAQTTAGGSGSVAVVRSAAKEVGPELEPDAGALTSAATLAAVSTTMTTTTTTTTTTTAIGAGPDVATGIEVSVAAATRPRHRVRLERDRPTPNERMVHGLLSGLLWCVVARCVIRKCIAGRAGTRPAAAAAELEAELEAGAEEEEEEEKTASDPASDAGDGAGCDVCRTCSSLAATLAGQIGVRRVLVAHPLGRASQRTCCRGWTLARPHVCPDLATLALFQTRMYHHLRAPTTAPTPVAVAAGLAKPSPGSAAIDLRLARERGESVARRVTVDARRDGGVAPTLDWSVEAPDASTVAADMAECVSAACAAATLHAVLGPRADMRVEIEAQRPVRAAPPLFWAFMAGTGAPAVVHALSEWRRRFQRRDASETAHPDIPVLKISSTNVPATAPGAAATLSTTTTALTPSTATPTNASTPTTAVAAATAEPFGVVFEYRPGNAFAPRHYIASLHPPPSATELSATLLTRLFFPAICVT